METTIKIICLYIRLKLWSKIVQFFCDNHTIFHEIIFLKSRTWQSALFWFFWDLSTPDFFVQIWHKKVNLRNYSGILKKRLTWYCGKFTGAIIWVYNLSTKTCATEKSSCQNSVAWKCGCHRGWAWFLKLCHSAKFVSNWKGRKNMWVKLSY